jgi:hypothetical protein
VGLQNLRPALLSPLVPPPPYRLGRVSFFDAQFHIGIFDPEISQASLAKQVRDRGPYFAESATCICSCKKTSRNTAYTVRFSSQLRFQ